jgi:hypothetical protein
MMATRKAAALTPAASTSLVASIGAAFGADKRVDWTPAEKVLVYKNYLAEIEVDGNKRGALHRAISLLPVDRRRRSTANAYTIISNLEAFAKKHARLFKSSKVLIGKLDLNDSVNAFSARIRNCLIAGGINTVAELVTKTEQELLRFPNMGVKSVAEIKEVLGKNGFKLTTVKLVPAVLTPVPNPVDADVEQKLDEVKAEAPPVAPTAAVQVIAETAMAELLAKLIKDADDRQVASLEIMLDQLDSRFKQLTAVLTQELDTRFKAIETRLDALKVKVKKPAVLVIGGLDAQRAQLQNRFPWLEVHNTNGQNLKALADKGAYDQVILWATFSSHSIEDVLKSKYGNDGFITVAPGKGLSTIIDIIARKFPKP